MNKNIFKKSETILDFFVSILPVITFTISMVFVFLYGRIFLANLLQGQGLDYPMLFDNFEAVLIQALNLTEGGFAATALSIGNALVRILLFVT